MLARGLELSKPNRGHGSSPACWRARLRNGSARAPWPRCTVCKTALIAYTVRWCNQAACRAGSPTYVLPPREWR